MSRRRRGPTPRRRPEEPQPPQVQRMPGQADRFVEAMLADGVDLGDQRQIDAWITGFNDRPFAERDAFFDGLESRPLDPDDETEAGLQEAFDTVFGDGDDDDLDDDDLDEGPVVLPPVALAEPAALEAAASQTPWYAAHRALLDLLGGRRPLTATGALRVADAQALDAVMPWREKRYWSQGAVRRAADLQHVDDVWQAATGTGQVEVTGRSARTARATAAATGPAHEVVAAVASLALERGRWLGEPPEHRGPVDTCLDPMVPAMLARLLHEGAPLPVPELGDLLAVHLEKDHARYVAYFHSDTPVRESTHEAVDRRLVRLERLGMVVRTGRRVIEHRYLDDVEAAEHVALTDLGRWWLTRTLPEYGFVVPVRGEVHRLDVQVLLELGPDHIEGWLEGQVPQVAAERLLQAVRDDHTLIAASDAGLRALAATHGPADWLVDRLTAATAEGRVTAGTVRWALEDLGLPVLPPPGDDGPVVALHDLLVGPVLGGDDVRLIAALDRLGGPDRIALLARRLWRVDSPFVPFLLDLLASFPHHGISRAAKKARFSVESRG